LRWKGVGKRKEKYLIINRLVGKERKRRGRIKSGVLLGLLTFLFPFYFLLFCSVVREWFLDGEGGFTLPTTITIITRTKSLPLSHSSPILHQFHTQSLAPPSVAEPIHHSPNTNAK